MKPLAIIGIFLLFMTTPVFAQDWKWAGFEIIGNHKVSRDEVLKLIPIKPGDKYQQDPTLWHEWCDKIKSSFKFIAADCSAVRYANFDAYLVIDLVEQGQEYRIQFRKTPTGSVPLVTPEIKVIYDGLYKRLWELFNLGTPPHEISNNGYLDYADPAMHDYVLELLKVVPPFTKNLFDVLKNDKDPQKRADAANFLNWTVNDLEQNIQEANKLLDDPSSEVRNNISRFTVKFVDKLKSDSARHDMIDQLLLQLNRPSHGDRNKAIYNLLFLAQKFPQDSGYMKEKGLALIQYIAETSVLSNVRDPAKDLLKLLPQI